MGLKVTAKPDEGKHGVNRMCLLPNAGFVFGWVESVRISTCVASAYCLHPHC